MCEIDAEAKRGCFYRKCDYLFYYYTLSKIFFFSKDENTLLLRIQFGKGLFIPGYQRTKLFIYLERGDRVERSWSGIEA